jgi:formate hydrogenlyase subunit 3/multisubunit Na+/H+ antiporter MnhD subunit
MDQLFALSVVVPLLAAAAILAARPLLSGHRKVLDLAAVLTSASVAVMLLFIVIRTRGGDSTYWFAGFRPVRGVVIGADHLLGRRRLHVKAAPSGSAGKQCARTRAA